MHLHSISISNIRSITELEWKAPTNETARESERFAGWHVIIGDNGAGKSTLLRAVALALIGPENADALRQNWSEWLPQSQNSGSVMLDLDCHQNDQWAGTGRQPTNYYLRAGIKFKRALRKVSVGRPAWKSNKPERHVWSCKPGWFSASFGPFRRFTGGDKDAEKLFYSHPYLARHLSVFGEDVALRECLAWLSQLRFEELDDNLTSGKLLRGIQKFINQDGFLPHGVRFEEVTSKSVRFVDANGVAVPIESLGDGFRSILSLTFELLRQMSACWPSENLFEKTQSGSQVVKHSGVVLIDEIDAHLHPTWQRRIGFWLTKHFPKVQFLVTTHSPLVCHAAEKGSIFRLPTPGTDESARMVAGVERERLIFGSVLDAYGTDLFGVDVSRSDSAQEKQQRLSKLNQEALNRKLSAVEARERAALQALFPASM